MKATSIIPCLGYKDAATAIDWLCNAFGFEKHLVVPGENGIIVHVELKLGNVMIMTGSSQHESEFSKRIKQPEDIGGFETQSPYIVLDDADIDEHYATAKAHGAKMLIELREEDYGGKIIPAMILKGTCGVLVLMTHGKQRTNKKVTGALLNKVSAVEVCDATSDAMEYKCRAHKTKNPNLSHAVHIVYPGKSRLLRSLRGHCH